MKTIITLMLRPKEIPHDFSKRLTTLAGIVNRDIINREAPESAFQQC